MILADLCNAVEKMSDKITCHWPFKIATVVVANYVYLVAPTIQSCYAISMNNDDNLERACIARLNCKTSWPPS